jgi:hypothetical protein
MLVILVGGLASEAWAIYELTERKEVTEDFTWRRCLAQITRNEGDDVTVNTFDFVNITSGEPDDTWVAADFAAIETRLNVFYNSLLDKNSVAVDDVTYRWYRMPRPETGEGPPPVRVTTGPTNIGGGSQSLPHQVACTVTKVTALRKHWGRIYVGPLSVSMLASLTHDGTFDHTKIDDLAADFEVLRAGAQADDFPMMVYDKSHKALHSVIGTRVDDIPDVQRRRRTEKSPYRKILP